MTESRRFAIAFDVLDEDVETVVRAAARTRDLLLVSDVRSPRVDALKAEVGADLIVASHRLIDSGLGLRNSDADLAAQIASAHAASPLGAILYASDALVDFGWYESVLRGVARGRLLHGLLASTDEILGDTHGFVELGPTLIGLWGDAATSDFVVACRPHMGLPEWLGVERLACDDEWVWDASQTRVVDARGLSRGELLVETMTKAEGNEGLVALVVSSADQGAAVHSLLPEEIAGRVVVCAAGDPWFPELVGHVGQDPISSLGERLREYSPARRSPPEPKVAVVDDMGQLGTVLDVMISQESEETLIAVAQDAGLAKAFTDGALLADLGFAAGPRRPMGDLDPGRLREDVVAIGPRARRAARIVADASPDFRTLVFRLTEPTLVTSAAVGLVPSLEGPHPLRLRTTRSPLDLGLRLTPALLPLPNSPAEPHPPVTEPLDPKAWVGGLRWGTRSRLVLPWRWNLLPKAMRGRW